ncbi:BREX-1 system adenine-specific DNA-methyltransferase PglX [Flavobacterium sp. XS2P14]|uniref:BREX-1 system adenine-specific DNA-methyltransferase PglX n=1 Tax=Flavobacterium sp. XS2P14 TaxID=3401735 RepID=UPI003AAE2CD8
MNTNALKKFAQEARRKLIEQVSSKLEYVLNSDSPELREKADQVRKLRETINMSSKAEVIDKVTYTWFNRFIALRFMDANEYQPIGIRVLTPKDGYTLPELLDEAKQGHIPEELSVKKQHIFDLLHGKTPSANAQDEAYKELLIGACNHLNKVFPFLFERINDYTELLLPDDLTSELSIVQDIRDGMTVEDCSEVEIIGWLYQFYISEKKDAVFASKTAVKKEDIPAATQLFTPRWIVEYMVQNTVGKLWLQNKPNSKLREHMPYFVESPSVTTDDFLKINSVEEITLLDQACGSGHILVYGFELLAKIYEEEGYNPSDIPQLIIKKNLFGFEIDERASQLASLALMMKARSYNRRFFRKEVEPNILCYKDLPLTNEEINEAFTQIAFPLSDELNHDLLTMQQATNFGSLIIPHTAKIEIEKAFEIIRYRVNTSDAFLSYKLEKLKIALEQLLLLSSKYHCIVDNPPYMGGGNMNKVLGDYVKTNYPDSKADLMACFMEAGLHMLQPKGFLGMINQETWMFKTTYKELREKLAILSSIDSMLHLGTRVFKEINGDKVRSTSFVMLNTDSQNNGVYYKLTEYASSESKRKSLLNKKCLKYIFDKKATKNITESNWAYWLTDNGVQVLKNAKQLNSIAEPKKGITTGRDESFLKLWFQVNHNDIKFNQIAGQPITNKWYPVNKGGGYRKWYGLFEYLILWENDGLELKNFRDDNGKLRSAIRNLNYNFKQGITWTSVSSTGLTCRYSPSGILMTDNGATIFNSPNDLIILGILNSKVGDYFLSVLTPGFKYDVGVINKFPIVSSLVQNDSKNSVISSISDICYKISKNEWNSREISWDFIQNELIHHKSQDLEETYDLYQQYWKNKFFKLHKNEEELNEQFIEIYGLQEELTPDVPLEDITILKEETVIQNGQLVFKETEVFAQFMSYAVGCMFGRYSLDKEGLILANQEETLEDYLTKVGKLESELSFVPDGDNIIPVLDDEWFEDDIVGRFYAFLKASFGTANFDKNLAFVEECLGTAVRKYFVKDFYNDHIKRYKKRPIYWMFSSPKGSFNVLIYMHRYSTDTLNNILNGYLIEYREKLNTHSEHLDHLIVSGSSTEQTKASKEKDKLKLVLLELKEYEREILYPLATQRINIDLDEGVLVNYNKFGSAIKEVKGLNDKATKKKVLGFDWINKEEIR